jgi:hypothetical protein
VQRHPPLLSGKPGYFGGFGNHRVLRLQHFQKFGWLPQMLRVFSEIRLVATNAPCPILSAFFAERVGNHNTQPENIGEIKSPFIRRATNAPCPIHFAFCAKWVGNRKTQSDNFKEK